MRRLAYHRPFVRLEPQGGDMTQVDYDRGYEDGRRSRDEEVASARQRFEEARGDLERWREEVTRLRSILHRPRAGTDDRVAL